MFGGRVGMRAEPPPTWTVLCGDVQHKCSGRRSCTRPALLKRSADSDAKRTSKTWKNALSAIRTLKPLQGGESVDNASLRQLQGGESVDKTSWRQFKILVVYPQ